jgi:hypothetical protein
VDTLIPALKARGAFRSSGSAPVWAYIPILQGDADLVGAVEAQENPLFVATSVVCAEMTLKRLREHLPFKRINLA